MQRRTFLLFCLFLATAWFYSSVASSSGKALAPRQQEQVELLRSEELTPEHQEQDGQEGQDH